MTFACWAEVIRDLSGLFQDDSVGLEHRIDITSHACGIVSQSHGGAADDEYVCDDARRTQALPERGESPLDLGPAKQNVIRLGHAASRSLADR